MSPRNNMARENNRSNLLVFRVPPWNAEYWPFSLLSPWRPLFLGNMVWWGRKVERWWPPLAETSEHLFRMAVLHGRVGGEM